MASPRALAVLALLSAALGGAPPLTARCGHGGGLCTEEEHDDASLLQVHRKSAASSLWPLGGAHVASRTAKATAKAMGRMGYRARRAVGQSLLMDIPKFVTPLVIPPVMRNAGCLGDSATCDASDADPCCSGFVCKPHGLGKTHRCTADVSASTVCASPYKQCSGWGYHGASCCSEGFSCRAEHSGCNRTDCTGLKKKCLPIEAEDTYEIARRQFKQQILPGGVWSSSFWNITTSNPSFPATTVWGFGPAGDPEPDSSALGGASGVAPAANSQFNYVAYTIETVRDKPVAVQWVNNLVAEPWKCDWRSPEGPDCEYVPHLTAVDQSLHWANPAKIKCKDEVNKDIDCRPEDVRNPELSEEYKGPVPMVVHVHGAHSDSESDGYPEAWYMPAASNLQGFATEGTLVNKYDRKTNFRLGAASFQYRNDQIASTLWYHDHSLGMTRNNVYAGNAGFWLVRDPKPEASGLVSGILPGPPPSAGESFEDTNFPGKNQRGKYREISLAMQDRSFKDDGAALFYPDNRAFFHDLKPEELDIPLVGNATFLSDIAPIWNPEAFFRVMIVNGVSWPVLRVEPDLYRFRLLNGCNSRFLNLALCVVPATGETCTLTPLTERDFYVIGGDQGFLPQVVQVRTGFKTPLPGDGTVPPPVSTPSNDEALLMAPAERYDVIVDFRGLAPGTVVRMINTGPDEPFGGFPVDPADENSTGQVMEFWVDEDTEAGNAATPPDQLVFTLADAKDPAAEAGENSTVTSGRDMALLEEGSELICYEVTASGAWVWDQEAVPDPTDPDRCVLKDSPTTAAASLPFGPRAALLGVNGSNFGAIRVTLWKDPIQTNPGVCTTEIWEFWNWSMDSHPIHVHLVKFRILSRAAFNVADGELLEELPSVPTEAGWKDTVIAYPGQVTRVVATFDIPGLYVWHCHILEHEDNEMMVPFCVGDSTSASGCSAVP